jgi:hypothetical protein
MAVLDEHICWETEHVIGYEQGNYALKDGRA